MLEHTFESWRATTKLGSVLVADLDVLMLTRARIARLSGVTERRLAYWEQTGLLHSTIDEGLSASRRTRLYDFQDAMTAMVLAALRQQVSLQHVRQIVDHLRGIKYEVTEVEFAVVGKQVYFQTPDGNWGGIQDPGQIVLHQVLDLRPLRSAVLGTGRREEAEVGRIEKRRGVHGSKPVLSGTRIPVRAVRAHMDAGRTEAEILAAYPALTQSDLEAVRASATA
jgi:uncharacterized protein (DUF433 family)/DNA-binding transcriptional MerR regulator